MQKKVKAAGRDFVLRSTISPGLATELQLFAVEDQRLAMSAAIGLAVVVGLPAKVSPTPGRSLYDYARGINDSLLVAGWSMMQIIEVGALCLAHVCELVPAGAFPTEPEVAAALGPTFAPDEELTDRG